MWVTGDNGTGFRRIKKWLADYPEIKFNITDLVDLIMIKFSATDTEIRNEGVNEGVKLLYETIKKNQGKRSTTLSLIIDTPQKTVERWLSVLKKKNKIEFRGSSKTGGYYMKTQK